MNTAEAYLERWPIRQAILIIITSGGLFIDGLSPIFFLVVFAHFLSLFILGSGLWLRPHSRLIANGVTATRLAILIIVGLCWSDCDMVTLATLFWIAATLDVVDGRIAKKFGGSSRFGALLDEEVDAFFVLTCSFIIWKSELGPWWIMGAGWIRYVVIFIKTFIPPNPERITHFTWAKTLAGLVFILFPLCLVLPAKASFYLQILTFSILLYSFLRELIIAYVYQNNLRNLPR